MRSLLLVDVDGPLHPFAAGAPPPGFVEYRWGRSWRRGTVRRAWLDPTHGAALLDLARCTGAELVWGSSWEHEANTTVGPALGLPALPVVGVRAYDGHPPPIASGAETRLVAAPAAALTAPPVTGRLTRTVLSRQDGATRLRVRRPTMAC